MSDKMRVLLLEPNRYRALIISRMLLKASGSVVLAQFTTGKGALDELAATAYDVAIVNMTAMDNDLMSQLEMVIKNHRGMKLVALGSPETPKSIASAIARLPQSCLIYSDYDDNSIPPDLSQAILAAGKASRTSTMARQLVAE